MPTTSETDRDTAATSWVKLVFYGTAIVFNLCLMTQVLTVGVAYFTDPAWWTVHVWLVRGYSGLHSRQVRKKEDLSISNIA